MATRRSGQRRREHRQCDALKPPVVNDRSSPGSERQRALCGRSGTITSMHERERPLQTGLSWPADFIQRGLDGLEGLLMSGATGQISEVDRGHVPKREPSTFTFDPYA
jgi:hypothetical protein